MLKKSSFFYVYCNKLRAINAAADCTWYIGTYPCNIEIYL